MSGAMTRWPLPTSSSLMTVSMTYWTPALWFSSQPCQPRLLLPS